MVHRVMVLGVFVTLMSVTGLAACGPQDPGGSNDTDAVVCGEYVVD